MDTQTVAQPAEHIAAAVRVRGLSDRAIAWVFIAPTILLLLAINIFPLLWTVYLSFTNWLSPWGGHETSPWHYLGGDRAAHRYTSRHGHRPKNVYGESLFPITAAAGARWARRQHESGRLVDVELVPRYLPGWAGSVARLPGVREVACWNVVVVGRRAR